MITIISVFSRRFFLAGLLCVFFFSPAAAGDSLEKVTMQVRWLHQFQFAGYYAAVEKGFYRDEGLDVTIQAGSPIRTPVSEVLAGNAQYGEANSELLYHYLEGEPLVALAAIFQHSPSILLARKDSGIRSPQQIAGKTVMMVGGTEDVDFLAMIANEGIDISTINIIPSSYDINDLIEAKTDLFNAYITNEPFHLKERGIESYIIEPGDYGINFYSDILFTSHEELQNNPERVKAFRRATIKGWEYAMDNVDEIINLILNRYGAVKSRQHLEYEAETMRKLILPDLVPVGNINPGRFEHMADMMVKFGLASPGYSLADFFYDPSPKVDRAVYQRTVLIIGGLLLLSGVVALVLWLFNKRLIREIRHRKLVEEQLQHSEHHYKSIINNLQDVYYRADQQGLIQDVSPSVEDVFGYKPEETIGTALANYYAEPFTREAFLADLSRAGGVLHNYEVKGLSKEGEERWVLVNSRLVSDGEQTGGVEGTIRDITKRKKAEERLEHLAHYDVLTDLPNRVLLADRLMHAMAQAHRRRQLLAVAYLDLDGFKAINDEHGHEIGDCFLQELAKNMENALRESDTLARLGGDEFVAVIQDIADEADSENLIQRLLNAASQPLDIRGNSLVVSASIGVTFYPQEESDVDAEMLLRQADRAMYQVKQSGKNNYKIFVSVQG